MSFIIRAFLYTGLFLSIYSPAVLAQSPYIPEFSTYIGSSGTGSSFGLEDVITSTAEDAEGNIYITGGTTGSDFPVTKGAGFQSGSCPSGEMPYTGMDVFISKFTSTGQLIWSRLLGGPCFDFGSAIKVDPQGYIYIGGTAGEGFPVTPGTVQPFFAGDTSIDTELLGEVDGFITKLTSDGDIVWSTYYGDSRDAYIETIELDTQGNIYGLVTDVNGIFPHITAGAYDVSYNGAEDVVVMKLSGDGRQTLFATYLGGSGYESFSGSLQLGLANTIYVAFETSSPDLPVTANAFQKTIGQSELYRDDIYIAQLDPIGKTLLYGTYLGGSENETIRDGSLSIDREGNLYIASLTSSSNYPITPGLLADTKPYPETPGVVVSKISPVGDLVASTFVGLRTSGYIPTGLISPQGSFFLFASSIDATFPVESVFPSAPGKGYGTTFVELAPSLDTIYQAGYISAGTSEVEISTARGLVSQNGSIIMAGFTTASDFPTHNPYQSQMKGSMDGFLLRFTPTDGSPAHPTHCPRRPEGDADCNDVIDLIDYICWREQFITKKIPFNCVSSDFDEDAKISIMDFVIWQLTFTRQ